MFKKSIFLTFFYFSQFLFSQTPEKAIDAKLKQAYNLVQNEKRNEAVQSLLEIKEEAKKINYKKGILDSNTGLILCYSFKREFKKVIDLGNESESIAEIPKDLEILAFIYQNRGLAYKATGFIDEAIRETNKSISYNRMLKDKDYSYYENSINFQNIASMYELKESNDSVLYYLQKSITELKKIRNSSSEKYNKEKNIIFGNMNIANYYMGVSKPQRLDLAEQYIEEILKYKNSKAYNAKKLVISNSLSNFYLLKKDYKSAINYANEVLYLEKLSHSPEKRRDAYSTLYETYSAMGDKDMQLKYLKLYTKINDSLNKTLQSEVETSAKQITNENKKEYHNKINDFSIYALVGICSIILIFITIWQVHIKRTKRKYEQIIRKINENENNVLPVEKDIENEISFDIQKNNSIQITDSTVQSILLSLDTFEKHNKFTEKDVNFAYLAKFANTNTRYLNEVLRTHKGKTFSKYINGLRINYIMKILYNEPKYREYKISYLAEICGFASREVFSTVFKKETGITTTYYINHLREEEKKEHAADF